jgi:hypothetical protein
MSGKIVISKWCLESREFVCALWVGVAEPCWKRGMCL